MANPSHLEMRNNIEKYRRMSGITEDAFQDRERELEKHWVGQRRGRHAHRRGRKERTEGGREEDTAILSESGV